jgi:hypothetical protein
VPRVNTRPAAAIVENEDEKEGHRRTNLFLHGRFQSRPTGTRESIERPVFRLEAVISFHFAQLKDKIAAILLTAWSLSRLDGGPEQIKENCGKNSQRNRYRTSG